jgi:hypothetical protein
MKPDEYANQSDDRILFRINECLAIAMRRVKIRAIVSGVCFIRYAENAC